MTVSQNYGVARRTDVERVLLGVPVEVAGIEGRWQHVETANKGQLSQK